MRYSYYKEINKNNPDDTDLYMVNKDGRFKYYDKKRREWMSHWSTIKFDMNRDDEYFKNVKLNKCDLFLELL